MVGTVSGQNDEKLSFYLMKLSDLFKPKCVLVSFDLWRIWSLKHFKGLKDSDDCKFIQPKIMQSTRRRVAATSAP